MSMIPRYAYIGDFLATGDTYWQFGPFPPGTVVDALRLMNDLDAYPAAPTGPIEVEVRFFSGPVPQSVTAFFEGRAPTGVTADSVIRIPYNGYNYSTYIDLPINFVATENERYIGLFIENNSSYNSLFCAGVIYGA